MNIESSLEKIGFSRKESLVYKTVLEVGNGSVIDVSKQSGIPKSTASAILERLVKRGLLKAYLKNNRKRYTATDPKTIGELLESQKNIFSGLLPILTAMYGGAPKNPKVQFYQGVDGIKRVLNEVLDEADYIRGVSAPHELFSNIPEILESFIERRIKKKIPIKLIFTDSPIARKRHELDKRILMESKIINIGKEFRAMIWIWGNKTAIFTVQQDFLTLIVESEDITDTLHNLFESMWQFHPEVK